MKKIIIFLFLFTFLISVNSLSAKEYVSSNIKEVTLLPRTALVKRKTEVEVNKGVNELLLEVESFNLDKGSVQAKVYGKGKVYGVQFEKVHVEKFPQEKVKKLQDKIDELQKERDSLINQKHILNKQWRFLDSLVDFSSTQIPKELKTSMLQIKQVNEIYRFIGKKYNHISSEKENLNKKIDKINRKIDTLERKLDAIKSPSQEVKKGIQIIFNSNKDQKVEIEASYLVRNCGWRPLYKVNVPLELENLNLTMFSKIRQKTGEDWKNVNLTVSNVVPLKGVRLPELESWYVDIREEVRQRKVDFGKQAMEARVKPKRKKQPAKYAQAKRKKLPISFEYELPQEVTIESKDKTTLLPLFTKNLKGEFFHRAIPKLNPLTFLVSRVKPDRELLGGRLNVYFGGRFVGETNIERKKAGEDFYLNLGADRGVKVNKEKIKDKKEESFFGQIERKTVVRKLAYKITAENLKDKPIKLKILDNIPVSQTDKIEVKNVKMEPEPDKKDYEDREGVNLWKLKLSPGEEKEINIKFTITYPKDEHIPGL